MKVKINGAWVDVKEGDDVTIPAEAKPEESTTTAEGNGDKDLEAQAKRIATEAVKSAMEGINLGGEASSVVSKKLEKFLSHQYGDQSKLKKILNGKDLYAGDELTKEEKIVGFFHALVTNNQHALKALSEGVDADGGYLFPNEFLGELIRELPNINVMRQEVRVIPMKRNKMDVTTLLERPKVYWTAENATKTTTTARFGTDQLTAFKAAAIIYSSDELIEDSTETDLVALIISLFSEAIADEEERVIWVGNGTTQPEGISVGTVGGTIVATGNAYNDITNLYYSLPAKYRANAKFYMNDGAVADLESVKDTTGRPLFNPSTDVMPSTIKGKQIVISNSVPDRQVYFADLKRGYFLGDRKRMTAKVSNDTETAFTKDQTAIRVVFRIGGMIALAAAIRKMTNF